MAAPFPGTVWTVNDSAGNPVSGAKIYTYEAGTLTAKAVYTSSALTTAASNPVICDASGRAQFFRGSGSYRFRVFDSSDVELTAYAADNISGDDTTAADLASAADGSGDALIATKQVGGDARTQHDRNTDLKLLTDYGSIVADGTDQTSNITTWLGTLASTATGLYVVPYNCKFYPPTVVAAMPYGVVFMDLSGLNDFSSAGETAKNFGFLSKDRAESDTHFRLGTSHHTILNLNNYGGAGTTSADERKASILWSAGQFALGSADKRGFRGAAIKQYTKETGAGYWIETLRSLAPWSAIDAEYEEWATGQTISGAGVYRWYGSYHYVSTGAGTTGATAPTHTTGTVSDGAVSWTWVDSVDRTVYSVDQHGRWIIGAGVGGDATFFHRVSLTDPDGAYRFTGASRGVSKVAQLRLTPTNSSSVLVDQPYLSADATDGLRLMKSDGSTALIRWTDAGGTNYGEVCSTFTIATDADTTPTVQSINVLYFSNTGATSVTALDDGSDGQIVELHFGNANTTLVNSSTFSLAGSTNVTPTANSVVTMRKLPTAITANRWVEVARSIK